MNDKINKISVVMTSYNGEKYIKGAIGFNNNKHYRK